MSNSLQWTMKVEEQEVGAAAGDVPLVTSVAGATKMDPGFKLFGKTIAVASAAAVYAFSDAGADAGALFGKRAVHGATAPICSQKNGCAGSSIALTEVEQNLDDLRSSSGSDSGMDNNSNPVLKTQCGLGPSGAETYKDLARSLDQAATTHTTEEEGEADDKTQQKQLEKIVTCPRCDSLDTKFCYYNNYNINQPRHFCKNCQRYWTAGGTLRNVPVGAGRRKNKHNGAHGPLQSSSEGEMVEAVCQEPVQIDLSDGRQEQASQKASPLKIPQPRHLGQMADRSSPPLLSSPGGSTDSCLTVNMSSPFSLHLSGPVSCHTFASTHNKMSFQSASDELGMKLSSDSPTRLGQKIKTPCSMNGALISGEITAGPDMVDSGSGKEDAASSLTGPVHTVIRDGHGFQHQISSAMYNQSMPAGDLGGWTSNGSPFSFFSGAWPYGYNVAWNGVPPMPSTSPFCTLTPGSLGCSPPGPNFASWCPAPGTLWTGAHWALGIPGTSGVSGVVSNTNRSFAVCDAASKVPGVMTVSGTSGVPWDPQGWSLPTPGATAGKRVSPEGGKAESIWGQKLMRIDYDNKSSGWSNRVGIKSDPDVIDTGNLFKGFHPKIENQSTTGKPFYKPHVFVNTMQFQETTT